MLQGSLGATDSSGSGLSHKFYVAHDREGTGRVSLHPWDLDLTWAFGILSCGGNKLTDLSCLRDPLVDLFWDMPEIRAAVYRRIRSILDGSLSSGALETRHRELAAAIGPDVDRLERDRWNRPLVSSRVPELLGTIEQRRQVFEDLPAVPSSQVARPPVVISAIHYKPIDDGPEFLEIVNTGRETVDMSAWTVDGVDLKLPYWTVIPARGRIVLTDNDRAFRAAHPGLRVIVIEYLGGLKGSGETLTLLDRSDQVIDVVSYADVDPWPTEPDQGQFSLELIDPALDNNEATAWRASTVLGGTPGTGPSSSQNPNSRTVTIRAYGTTGVEKLELRSGNLVIATISLTDAYQDHVVEVDGETDLSKLRVAFVNNGTTAGRDRNARIDYVRVGNEQVQAEDPTVHSTGTYSQGSCGPGFKRSEWLHCNGYLDFSGLFGGVTPPTVPPTQPPTTPPTTPPTDPSGTAIRVLAIGNAGGERVQLSVDGTVVKTWTMDRQSDFYRSQPEYQRLDYTHPTVLDRPDIRVSFINDGLTDGRDRNVRVDAIVVAGTRYESEHESVSSRGVYAGGALCRPGNWRSEYLHCNGYFDYVVSR